MANVFQKKPSKLDEIIDKQLSELADCSDVEEKAKLMAQLERLIKLRNEDRSSRVSPDTLVTVAGSLLGILTIVAYEQKHVMVSKALGMVIRSKQP